MAMVLSLKAKIFTAFAVALGILGVVSWASYENAAATVNSAHWVGHTRDVLEGLDAVVVQIANAEGAYRAFLVWGQPAFLQPLDSAFRETPAVLARLRVLTADNPGQQGRLDELTRLVAQRLTWSQRIVDARRAFGPAAAQRVLSEATDPSFTIAFHHVVTEMKGTEEQLLLERTVALNSAARRTKVLVLIGGALAVLLAVLAAVQVSRDLAARQRAERTLRESEERFRALVEGVRDYAIFSLDPEGRVVTWNAGAERLKQYRAQEVLGQHFARFYTPEDVALGKPERALRVAATEGRSEDEGWRVRRDGSRFWANAVLAAIRDHDGALLGFAKITRDMTERRRTEQALRESEERYRLLFDANPMPAWVYDTETLRVLAVNDAAVRHYGYSREEFLALTIKDIRPPEDVPRLLETVAEVRVTAQPVGGAWRHRTRDGTVIDVEITPHALRLGGRPAQLVIAVDVTERNRKDEELRRYAAQLEAANAELDAFAYSVSHDLRAPLRSIDGFSQALLEDAGPRLDDTGRGHLERVRAASQRMATLIDDLLNLSRVTRAELRRQAVDLTALAQETVAELRRIEPDRAVECVIAPDLVVDGDPHLLRVVLVNLLGNAWKYTRRRAPARIELGVTVENGGGSRAYYVQDNGAGFDMAYAGKLFGAFQRLHRSADFEGTGIGLATVQRIVHRHGGRVWAEGAVDQGATFYFTL